MSNAAERLKIVYVINQNIPTSLKSTTGVFNIIYLIKYAND